MHTHNSFITLTYNKEHLPDDLSLRIDHWQNFAKRLRKSLSDEARKNGTKYQGFRFFHCGEYGEENLRPHYHACLFGLDFHHDRQPWKKTKNGLLFSSKRLETIWGKGFASIGQLTYQSAAYVARYVMKKAAKSHSGKKYTRFNPETGETWEVKPEYVTMSRRPGLGAPWLTEFIGDVYPSDEVIHDGQKFRPPRFYDQHLDDNDLDTVKKKRAKEALRHKDNNTPERLKVREKVAEAKITQLKRNL